MSEAAELGEAPRQAKRERLLLHHALHPAELEAAPRHRRAEGTARWARCKPGSRLDFPPKRGMDTIGTPDKVIEWAEKYTLRK
jgi:hypothetical protein